MHAGKHSAASLRWDIDMKSKMKNIGVFGPKKDKDADKTQKRIDQIVKRVKQEEALAASADLPDGVNVFQNRLQLRRGLRLRSTKLG